MRFKAILWTYEPKADGTCAIKIRINDGISSPKYHLMKWYCLPEHWDKSAGRVKDKRPNADKINAEIASALFSFENSYLKNKDASIQGMIDQAQDKRDRTKLNVYIEDFIKRAKEGRLLSVRKKKPFNASTIRAFGVTKNNLLRFNKNLIFKSINDGFYNDWSAWMRKEKYAPSTIGKEIKHLKWFMMQAVKDGWTTNTAYTSFIRPDSESDTIYLDDKEIEMWTSVEVVDWMNKEKKRFITAYYLLLRFSDSLNIDPGFIYEKNGRYYLKVCAIKTGSKAVIPIKPIVYEYLKEVDFKIPPVSNQHANETLKLIGTLAKINTTVTITKQRGDDIIKETAPKHDFITTHTSRRSGATNLWKSGVPVKVIMDLGGWKTESEFYKYIRAKEEEIAEMAADYDFFK